MPQAMIDHLTQLHDTEQWTAVVELHDSIMSLQGPAYTRAEALYILGRAYWRLARDPFDYARAVQLARETVRLDDLGGRAPKALGIRLVTLGRYQEGTRILQAWISRFHQWDPAVQAELCDVTYALGYAARYQGDYLRAEMWYSQAAKLFGDTSNDEWAALTTCGLAQVKARLGRTDEARELLMNIPQEGARGAYRLKTEVEILTAEGRADEALAAGENARDALLELDDPDPWELAELHMLLARLQYQAGNLASRDRHLYVVDQVLRQSPRHDLYAQARLLLDLDEKEVAG